MREEWNMKAGCVGGRFIKKKVCKLRTYFNIKEKIYKVKPNDVLIVFRPF